MLFFSTVSPELKSALEIVMNAEILKPIRKIKVIQNGGKKRFLGFARAFKLFFLTRNVGFSQDSLSIYSRFGFDY
ncbi:hypothetical protein [Epilithonimonas vandammei]|uniref:hypothetical protein n=1 Tax=Epilithonimonas vandammei TaxID=2487072 RepID=UPI0028AA5F7E|nr:hypothetical protein [Epilithonimonas vandammei]